MQHREHLIPVPDPIPLKIQFPVSNLAKDVSEANNLADKEPGKLKELQELLAKIRGAGTSKLNP